VATVTASGYLRVPDEQVAAAALTIEQARRTGGDRS